MIRNIVLGISIILALSGFVAGQKVAGAWRLDEIKATRPDVPSGKFTNPNMYLFTKGSWSIIRVEGDKPRSMEPWASMTQDQVVDTYIKQFSASGGTYEMKGNTLTMKTTIAKNPAYMARANWISYVVKITGQTMTLTAAATNEGPIKNPQILTLTRLD
ncbi:MAG: hypothetical protein JO053_02455 [Acidobacteria bacterium]|nr:hypothetical protein [Acidobacteriota bacterium]